ncbi:two-component system response regulator YesN [Paenibacillus sp. DS2015]|uniref:response regulator transcription factor n=1 Tax=Paenibacillus sp. DS2015 TaxID=3373917 RepID=UPI003D2072E6
MNDLCKVLIVDDEYLVRQGIKHLLNWEAEGFQMVGEANNGKEALERVAVLRPHIVITDIVMPVMDGEEFTRTLKATYPEIEIIVLSSFSEFEYVKSTFQSGIADYILKPTLETEGLLNVLRATANKIPSLNLKTRSAEEVSPSVDHIIDKLLSGYEAKVDSVIIRETFPYDRFYLLGCYTKYALRNKDKESSQIKSELSMEVGKFLSPEGICYHLMDTDPDTFVLLLNFAPSKSEQVVELVRMISTSLFSLQLELCWVISEPFQGLEQVGGIYREPFLKRMDYSFYFPDRRIIIGRELPQMPKMSEKFNLNHFTDELKRKRTDVAFQYLQEYVEGLATQYENDVFEFRSFLSNIIFVITTLLSSSEVDSTILDEEKYVYFKKIDEAKHVDEAIALLHSFLNDVRQLIASSDNKDSHKVQQLLDYMHEHYAEQLSLAELAKHFHFNTTYLSSYFSTHAKEGFSEYLNKIRIKKAAELLNHDNITISEISGRVGYSDHSYFCKVFKKFTGHSPSTYRKKYMKQEK